MFKLKLAIKYLLKKPISWLAVLAVAVSVFIVLVVMTVMHGLVVDFSQKNHKFVGDCIVFSDSLVGFPYYEGFIEKLSEDEDVEAVSPSVLNMALLSIKGYDVNFGVNLIGIEPESYSQATGFYDSLYKKVDDASKVFEHEFSETTPGCVRGISMMNRPDGQGKFTHSIDYPIKLTLTCFPLSYKGTLLKAGADVVNTKSFYVSNDSQSGLAKVDVKTVYVDVKIAQELCGMNGENPRVSALFIKFKDSHELAAKVENVNRLWKEYSAELMDGPYKNLIQNVKVQDWRTYRRESIAPMEKEQTMLIALFFLIGLVTLFIIFVVFFMIVNHKRKDIGILKSFGVSTAGLTNLFLNYSILIGVLGSLLGAAAGWGFLAKANEIENWLFHKFGWQVWDRSLYSIGAIPNKVMPEVVCTIIVCAIVACMIGAFMPSFKAAKQKPVDILQVDQL